MRRLIPSVRVTVLVVLAVVVFAVSRIGYGQSQNTLTHCQPFQVTVVRDVLPGTSVSTGTMTVTPGTKITIELIALRIDAVDFVVPAIARVTTTVNAITSAYYLPIPMNAGSVVPSRPFTLMQSGPLYADGGTNVTLLLGADTRYQTGTGRAEWSVSGMSCPA